MLKGINPIISPELAKVLMEMGHTDEIVICDGNMPVGALNQRIVQLYGLSVTEILEAVLEVMPLDQSVERPVAVVGSEDAPKAIWKSFSEIIGASEERKAFEKGLECVNQEAFMVRCRNAYALIATTEKTLAANILLRKGVIC